MAAPQVISLGLGSPSAVGWLLTLGLSDYGGPAVEPFISHLALSGQKNDTLTLSGESNDTIGLQGNRRGSIALTGDRS